MRVLQSFYRFYRVRMASEWSSYSLGFSLRNIIPLSICFLSGSCKTLDNKRSPNASGSGLSEVSVNIEDIKNAEKITGYQLKLWPVICMPGIQGTNIDAKALPMTSAIKEQVVGKSGKSKIKGSNYLSVLFMMSWVYLVHRTFVRGLIPDFETFMGGSIPNWETL